jgi:hypothetical protein
MRATGSGRPWRTRRDVINTVKRAYCTECGQYVDLDESEVCPAGHPKPCYRDIRESVSSEAAPSGPRPATVTPLAVASASGSSRWVVLIVSAVIAVLVGCACVVVGLCLVLRRAQDVAREPYPPFVQEQPGAYAAPNDKQQRWALALSAVLSEQNNDRHDILGGIEGEPYQLEAVRARFADGWGIESREDLLGTLAWLEGGGHRRGYDQQHGGEPLSEGIAAWDYGRYVALCRWGYVMGYLTEVEAWQKIMPVARLMQTTYPSWREYGEHYVNGREFWSPGQSDAASIRAIYDDLVVNPQSPWVQLPWDLDLGGSSGGP